MEDFEIFRLDRLAADGHLEMYDDLIDDLLLEFDDDMDPLVTLRVHSLVNDILSIAKEVSVLLADAEVQIQTASDPAEAEPVGGVEA